MLSNMAMGWGNETVIYKWAMIFVFPSTPPLLMNEKRSTLGPIQRIHNDLLGSARTGCEKKGGRHHQRDFGKHICWDGLLLQLDGQ